MTDVQSCANIVAFAHEAEILQTLRDPQIMAVIWSGAWSQRALHFAHSLSQDQALTQSGKSNALRDVINVHPNRIGADAFKSDLMRFERLFRLLGMQMHFGATINDRSRLESTSYYGLNVVPSWHVDSGYLALLSVPSGPTTEYIDGFISGTFKDVVFTPSDNDAARATTKTLNNDDVMIFKCRPFAQGYDYPSFIHKRPYCLDLAAAYPNRPVVHMKLS